MQWLIATVLTLLTTLTGVALPGSVSNVLDPGGTSGAAVDTTAASDVNANIQTDTNVSPIEAIINGLLDGSFNAAGSAAAGTTTPDITSTAPGVTSTDTSTSGIAPTDAVACTVGDLASQVGDALSLPAVDLGAAANIELSADVCAEIMNVVDQSTVAAAADEPSSCSLADLIDQVAGPGTADGLPSIGLPDPVCQTLFGTLDNIQQPVIPQVVSVPPLVFQPGAQ